MFLRKCRKTFYCNIHTKTEINQRWLVSKQQRNSIKVKNWGSLRTLKEYEEQKNSSVVNYEEVMKEN